MRSRRRSGSSRRPIRHRFWCRRFPHWELFLFPLPTAAPPSPAPASPSRPSLLASEPDSARFAAGAFARRARRFLRRRGGRGRGRLHGGLFGAGVRGRRDVGGALRHAGLRRCFHRRRRASGRQAAPRKHPLRLSARSAWGPPSQPCVSSGPPDERPMRLPQVGQSFRSFWASWSHQGRSADSQPPRVVARANRGEAACRRSRAARRTRGRRRSPRVPPRSRSPARWRGCAGDKAASCSRSGLYLSEWRSGPRPGARQVRSPAFAAQRRPG